MKLKKVITVIACGLIALVSIISNIAVYAEEIQKLEIPVNVIGGTGTVEIRGNDDDSELALEGNQIIETDGTDAFFVGYNNEPCDHEYTVKQTSVSDGYTMDTTKYTVHVFVSQEEDGLVPTVAVWKNGTETKCDSVSFENKKIEADTDKDTSGKKSSDTSDSSDATKWLFLTAGTVCVALGVLIFRKNREDKDDGDDK